MWLDELNRAAVQFMANPASALSTYAHPPPTNHPQALRAFCDSVPLPFVEEDWSPVGGGKDAHGALVRPFILLKLSI